MKPIAWNDYEERIQVACRGAGDLESIPKVPDAGQLVTRDERQWQVMFNGLLVEANGYYGDWMTELIRRLKGHHEPQEERVFHELLEHVGQPSSMIELGSYWAWYSMWFKWRHPDAVSVIVEPSPENLAVACRNANANQIELFAELGGVFAKGARRNCGTHPFGGNLFKVPSVSVSGLMEKYGFERLSILHADIQGAELPMLEDAAPMLAARRIENLVVSTHWPAVHERCRALLAGHGYHFVADHTPEESFTIDGLIVARSPELPPFTVPILKRHE